MARSQNKLSPLVVKNLKQKGLYADGGGLYLRVGEAGNKSWIFRFRRHGRLRDMGLGALHTITLAEARAKAVDCRKLLLAGIDPLDTKKAVLPPEEEAAVVAFRRYTLLPLDRKFTATCDDALLGSAIGWLLEASDKYKVKLSSKDLSKWASYVYKEAVEQPLNFKQTQYLAVTIVKVIRQGRG